MPRRPARKATRERPDRTARSVETRQSVEYTEEIEDLFAIDFDAQVAAALAAGNHRRAL